ncbi:MAG: right-handed parallel beta-helix repeat-containing protein [Deltaproteobacteria bacterium]|nr:right-handed parallel beta-helix repeat-containing protein [Deltaproteobacteria bacterium]
MTRSRTRAVAIWFVWGVISACGDDDTPTRRDAGMADGASDDAALDAAPPEEPCLVVDGRGGAGADGSASRPFATIDDALASAAGNSICLVAGEHAPPTNVLPAGTTLRGVGRDEESGASVVQAALGSCIAVDGLDAADPRAPPIALGAVLVTGGPGAAVTVRALVVRGCEAGIVARGDLVLDDVLVDGVVTGVALDRDASADVEATEVHPLTFSGTPFGSQAMPFAFQLGAGSRLVAHDAVIVRAEGLAAGVAGHATDVDLSATTLRGGLSGLLIDNEEDPTRRVRLGPGTLLAEQTNLGSDGAINQIVGGEVEVDGARIEGSESRGLELLRVSRASLRDTVIEGCRQLALGVYGSEVTIGPGLQIDVPDDTVGIAAAGSRPLDGGPEREAAVAVTGAMRSQSGDRSIHLAAFAGAQVRFEVAGSRFEGGWMGAYVSGAQLALLEPVEIANVTADGIFGEGAGTRIEVHDLSVGFLGLDPTIGGAGVTLLDGAEAQIDGLSVRGGNYGLWAQAPRALSVAGLTSSESVRAGLVLVGAPPATSVRVEGATLTGSGGPGAFVSGEWDVALLGAVVRDNGGHGVQAQQGTRIEVRGCELGDNAGAALAFFGASGTVTGSTFDPSLPAAEAGSDTPRADEVRIVASSGETAEVTVGDDGDGVPDAMEDNLFRLLGARDCSLGGCALILAEGDGATGIVGPNCLTADASATSVFTLVEQRGARFEFLGTSRAFYDAQLAGTAVDLGLATGVALPDPDTPVVPALDAELASPGRSPF